MAKKTPNPAAAAGGSGAFRDRIREYRRIRSADLVANPLNWRQHPENQQNAMRGILEEVGIVDALLVRDRSDGTYDIIDGHLRASLMPEDEVPCLVLDVDEDEARKILLTFDPLGAMAEANTANLNELLRDAEFGAEALQELVAGLAEDAGLYQTADGFSLGEPELQEDEIPEPPVDPITKPGDLWILGEHRLLCGDSTKAEDVERLMDGGKAAACVTDPPYNIDYGNIKHPKSKVRQIENDNMSGSHFREFCTKFATLIKDSVVGCVYVFGPPGPDGRIMFTVLDEIMHCSTVVIWNKDQFTLGRGKYQNKYEPCWFGWTTDGTRFTDDRTLTNVWDFPRPHNSEEHPTMKPIAVMACGMGHSTQREDVVYDPFLGSGTTLIAAEQLNRKCYGMEISPQYCDVIVKRWELLTGKTATRESAE